jgi:hypothetical protein
MMRFAPLLLLLLAGCQRPVAAVLTYAPAPVALAGEDSGRKITPTDVAHAATVLRQKLYAHSLPCSVSLDASNQVRIEVFDKNPALVQEIDRLVCMTGTFEFRIAANSADHAELIDRARETEGRVVRDDQDKPLGWWVPIDEAKKSDVLVVPDLITREIDSDGHTIA